MTEPLNKYASGKELSTAIVASEPTSTFNAVCNIAGMEPTLFLDFAANDYRIYSAATGLQRKALTDIITTTGLRSTPGNIYRPIGGFDDIAINVPRIDYDPETGICRGLLVEESRQNLFLNSLLDGTSLTTQTVTVTAAAHTVSFFGSGSITFSGAYTGTLSGTDDTTWAVATFTPSAGGLVCTVSGDVKWAQCELGSFATSPITTAGTAATRAADVVKIDGTAFAGFNNPLGGTLFASGKVNSDAGFLANLFSVSSERVQIYEPESTLRTAGNSYGNGAIVNPLGSFFASAIAYEAGYGALATNGISAAFVTPPPSVPTLSLLRIGDYENTGVNQSNGPVGSVIYFPKPLTQAQLAQLTRLGA